jgi:hypothetical protein
LLESERLMKRWQDPPIKVRDEVPRPYYYIRPYIPAAGSAGFERERRRIRLGFVDETTTRQAEARKQEVMAPINQGKFLLEAQIRFSQLVEKYRSARMPGLGAATRTKYETHLANHILPVFGKAELADVDRASIEVWLNREAQDHSHGEKEYGGLGWYALADVRNILSAIFRAAKDWGLWQGENPSQGVRLPPRQVRREKRLLEADDLRRSLAELKDTVIMTAEEARVFEREPGTPPDDRDLEQHIFRPAAEAAGDLPCGVRDAFLPQTEHHLAAAGRGHAA